MKTILKFISLSLLSATLAVHAQTLNEAMGLDTRLGITTIPLYDAPVSGTEQPTLTVFIPQRGKGNGSAIVIAPGGGYINLAMDIEGRQVADWFTARGFTAFVLKYRLGPQNIFPVPLQDAQRAIRLVRSFDKRYAIDPTRIGMIGFSAGGHLAEATSVFFDEPLTTVAAPGSVDRLSDRPDFVVLGYPWNNAMQPLPLGGAGNYCRSLKITDAAACSAFEQPWTPSYHVKPNTPPTFIYSTTDDKAVPIKASIDYYNALLAAGVSAELHIFRHGAHGSGLGTGDAALDLWPALLEQWLRDQGFLPPASPTYKPQ